MDGEIGESTKGEDVHGRSRKRLVRDKRDCGEVDGED